MPLSEHEQRLLEQIERALYAEDPKFASSVRSTDLKRHYRRRIVKGGALFVVGLAVLLGGTVSKLIPVGVLGFLLMLAGALVAVAGWKRLTGSGDTANILPRSNRTKASRSSGGAAASKQGPSKQGPSKQGPMERLEERWRRRNEDRDGGR
ncbi:MAG: hypothetical protein QOJ92_1763 [Frankiales bacterium]|nr:hypothetical protein [Frankiales bacterium]MDX6274553.1 hypothetical protein [Frankiales bacterium]